jgi:hypothetical protein
MVLMQHLSHETMGVSLVNRLPFVRRTYRTYSIGLHGMGNAFSSRETVGPIRVIIWNEKAPVGFEMRL